MLNHTLKNCHANLHLKSYDERNSSSFNCLTCFYSYPANNKCLQCGSKNIKEENGHIVCYGNTAFGVCGYSVVGHLDLVEEAPPEPLKVEEKEEKHEHIAGLRKGLINRDYC